MTVDAAAPPPPPDKLHKTLSPLKTNGETIPPAKTWGGGKTDFPSSYKTKWNTFSQRYHNTIPNSPLYVSTKYKSNCTHARVCVCVCLCMYICVLCVCVCLYIIMGVRV